VVLALSVSLCAGPWALAEANGPALLRSVAVVFLVLIVLRIADDLCSLEHDRIASPERALPAGRIGARPLAVGAALLFAAAALLSAPRLTLGLGLVAAYYAAYYALVERIPVVLHEQNSVPGLTNRLACRAAAEVHLAFASARRFFPKRGHLRLSGNPLREQVTTGSRQRALRLFEVARGYGDALERPQDVDEPQLYRVYSVILDGLHDIDAFVL
jgi:hypothetical protein